MSEFWNDEMERLTGNISEENIKQMQEDLRGGLSFYKERFDRIRQMTPPQIDLWHYRDGHNYMDFISSMENFQSVCMQGTEYLFNDFHNEALSGQTGAINELIPRVFVNDLVLRLKAKGRSGEPDIHYYYFKNDEELGVLFCSYYERRNLATSAEKAAPLSVLFKDEGYHNPSTETIIEHICSWAIPLDFLYLSLFVGMHGKWMDNSFTDYPIFVSWETDEPYRLFSEDYKKNRKSEDVSLIQEGIETAFGFQRYLISVAEKREKIEVVPDKERNRSLKKPSSEAEMKEYRNNKKSIISLSDAIRIYANDQRSVRQIRKPKKCEYRYSVREHVRHYKNGKTVKIKSYDKNKDLPFRPHKYVV